jgi:hypothetical protein
VKEATQITDAIKSNSTAKGEVDLNKLTNAVQYYLSFGAFVSNNAHAPLRQRSPCTALRERGKA